MVVALVLPVAWLRTVPLVIVPARMTVVRAFALDVAPVLPSLGKFKKLNLIFYHLDLNTDCTEDTICMNITTLL